MQRTGTLDRQAGVHVSDLPLFSWQPPPADPRKRAAPRPAPERRPRPDPVPLARHPDEDDELAGIVDRACEWVTA